MAVLKKKRARIIALEGADGVGKTTQAQALLEGLVRIGKRAVVLKLPMALTPTGRIIYSMLDSGTARRWPTLFQGIQLVDRLGPQVACLPFLLASQDYVVFDRWSASAAVYGRATCVPSSLLRLGERLLVRPDAVILLAGPGRSRARDDDSYERSLDLQHRVKGEFAVWVDSNPDIAVTVNASGSPETVSNRIWNVLVDKEIV